MRIKTTVQSSVSECRVFNNSVKERRSRTYNILKQRSRFRIKIVLEQRSGMRRCDVITKDHGVWFLAIND